MKNPVTEINGSSLAHFYDKSAKLIFTWETLFPDACLDPVEVMSSIDYEYGAQAMGLFLDFYPDAYSNRPRWPNQESRIMGLLFMADVVRGHYLMYRNGKGE
jgi:hypothetical protein